MKHVTNDKPPRPRLPSSTLALLLAAALAGAMTRPAAAQAAVPGEAIQIAIGSVEFEDERSLARIRRQIGSAARSVCDSGGLASVYRNGTRRCRDEVVADAETQLRSRIVTRLATTAGR